MEVAGLGAICGAGLTVTIIAAILIVSELSDNN